MRYLLTLIGLCALATFPIAQRACTAKNRSREATTLLAALGDRIADHVRVNGRVPSTAAPRTPVLPCCARGGVCISDAAMWIAPGWRNLEFSIDGRFRFSYEYIPDPSGRSAIVRAVGDVHCNGILSTYELRLAVNGRTVERAWSHKDPYE